jgi:predicted PurR-regulated permease PerM
MLCAVTGTGRGAVIGQGVSWTARWSLRLILAGAGAVLLWLLIAQLWSIVFPVLLAVIISTLLWPPTAWLRRHGFPPAPAAATTLLGALVLVGGLITLVGTSVAGAIPQIAASVSGALTAIQDWVKGPPLNLGQSQLDDVITQITTQIQRSISTISTSVLTGLTGIASGLVTFVLALVLVFLFIKDGPRFLPWLRQVAGDGAGGHISTVLGRIWVTLGSFIRTQAVVSLVDAVLIGGGLLIVGVPLALPLAVLTFLGGFIPIVGAVVAGALAVLVALVSNGFTAAVIILAVVLAVQQIEGNVLQPFLQSRSLGLHSVVVLLAITAGSTLYGIAGAFLAVPAAAAAAVLLRYLGELIDERAGVAVPPVEPPPDVVAEPVAEPVAEDAPEERG